VQCIAVSAGMGASTITAHMSDFATASETACPPCIVLCAYVR